ncbi:MAG: hypothetical protein RLZZ500_1796 [Bacteroidota bacterium]|jgi:REP element-mobilizing transposase RayT
MKKFKNKYRIPSSRLQGYDYGSNGIYFITINTKNRKHYFGTITAETHNGASLQATEIGKIAQTYWADITNHYPFVTVDAFVVMPDHMHGILIFNNPEKKDWTPNSFGVQSNNLAAVIRGFKSSTKRYANQNNIEFEWQPRFHESIIRDENALNTVRRYIINNPIKWLKRRATARL